MSAGRRVLLVVPFPLGEGRGNSVSAARLADALRASGCEVEVRLATEGDGLLAAAAGFRPDLVHAIHAWRSGPAAARVAAALGVPLVVSFRGTDTGTGLTDPVILPAIARVLEASAAVTTLTDDEARRVREAFPSLRARLEVVPHAVHVPPIDREASRRALGLGERDVVVAHVAGIRRVKGFPEAWALADALRAAVGNLRYVHAGAVLDEDLGPAADAWFASRPWALRLGGVDRDAALRALAAADASLHASFVEGLSNALLESMALGVVPVARDIPASRAAVTDGADGLLFRDDAGAVAALRRLLGDEGLAAPLLRRAPDRRRALLSRRRDRGLPSGPRCGARRAEEMRWPQRRVRRVGSRRRRTAPGRPAVQGRRAVQGRARYVVTPRVLLFLTRGGRWLFLEGGPEKWFAGRLNGLGGSVEAGEDARAAAVREAREECGLAPSVLRLAAVVHVSGRARDRAGIITLDGVRRNARAGRRAVARRSPAEVGVLVFVFAGKLPPGPLRASSEGALVWHPLAALRDPAVPFLDDVRTLLPRVAAQRAGAVPFFSSTT